MKKDKIKYAASSIDVSKDNFIVFTRSKTNFELEEEINDLTKRIIKLENRTIN